MRSSAEAYVDLGVAELVDGSGEALGDLPSLIQCVGPGSGFPVELEGSVRVIGADDRKHSGQGRQQRRADPSDLLAGILV